MLAKSKYMKYLVPVYVINRQKNEMSKIYVLLICILFWIDGANAQGPSSNRAGLYWVVESNIRDRSYTIVRIYNSENAKIYEVRLRGEYIDIKNPRHRLKLDMIVRQVNERTSSAKQQKKKVL